MKLHLVQLGVENVQQFGLTCDFDERAVNSEAIARTLAHAVKQVQQSERQEHSWLDLIVSSGSK